MDKKQARDIVRDTLGEPFAKEAFTRLAKELFNQIDESKAFHARGYVPESYKKYVKTFERLATYTDPDGLKIDILIVYLQSETTLERARTSQRNFIAHYLKDRDQKDAGLVAFVSPDPSDWRFSLVKMDYRFEEEKNGKVKVKEEFTPARRWSFLVGTNENSHTAQSRLAPLIADDTRNPKLAGLEEAFNIETVTKEFFTEYRNLFLRVKEALDVIVAKDATIKNNFEQNGVNTVDFAKKLLGQIVFLYFLQKKGWFGVAKDAAWGTGSKQFLRELFEQKHCGFKNFFNDILEPLFYEALRLDRGHEDHYYSRFNCKIPFLNGGLFDPINGYDWVKTDILISNELFSNSSKTNKGDTGDGILDVFDRYNFTVKEDEPLEKEVAIDPELLGKAYEKFNAIRPDNFDEFQKALKSGKKGDESKFNKQFGVYYTPREIVHYMCQQSLINYLFSQFNDGTITYEKPGVRQTNMLGNTGKKGQLDLIIEHKERPAIPKEDIETLIHYGERLSDNEEMALIKQQKINDGQQKTSDYKLQLPYSIRNNATEIDDKLLGVKVCDPAIGSGAFPVGMMSEIVRARNTLSTFIKNTNRSIYHFKRDCIENSLYGVDIDSGAVEIAKLRLWLSLVVDEDDIRQIKPLPNLDYKIVCGNSLLGLPADILPDAAISKEIEEKKKQYFSTTSPSEKNKIRETINSLFSQLMGNIKKYDPTIADISFDFHTHFSEVFHEKGGFDVVIGNPPYISAIEFSNKYGDELRIILNKNYKSARGAYDIFILFIEKGLSLTCRNGCLVFITPNKYLSASYSVALRSFILSKYSLMQIVDLSPIKVFEEAAVYPIISIIQNAVISVPVKILLPPAKGIEIFNELLFNHALVQRSMLRLLPENLWGFLLSNQVKVLEKLIKSSNELQKYGDVIATSTASEADEYGKHIHEGKQADSMKLINTGTIGKWKSFWGINELTHAGKKFIKPNLKINNISNRRLEIYKSPKILFAKLAKSCEAFLDINGKYSSLNTNCFYKPNEGTSIRTIAAICNSKIFMFLYAQLFGALRMSGGYFQFQAPQLRIMPIKYPTTTLQNNIDKIVDCILTAKHADPQADTSVLEKEIDKMIYVLYGLTPEEIAIVEGEK